MQREGAHPHRSISACDGVALFQHWHAKNPTISFKNNELAQLLDTRSVGTMESFFFKGGSMRPRRVSLTVLSLLVLSVLFTVTGAVPSKSIWNPRPELSTPPGMKDIVSLWDFRDQEVKGAGFELSRDAEVHISAIGGGDRGFWRDMFNNEDESGMFASGWIINADTRELVWEMTLDNTSGRSSHRSFDDNVSLNKGSYEVYYSAHSYYRSSSFSTSNINIDRRRGSRSSWSSGSFFGIFDRDNENLYDEFMDYAKDYGITISIDEARAGSVSEFTVPKKGGRMVLSIIGVGDGELIRRHLKIPHAMTVHIYALGEATNRDEEFDHGWLVNSSTRERVWEMADRHTRYAGGASKNIRWSGDVELAAGTYELYYVTDDSHSTEDWNAKPPYDPLMYGISISAANDRDVNAVSVGEIPDLDATAIVRLTKPDDNDFLTAGFSLKKDTKIRVYALGEMASDRDMADYGWIVSAKTRERVWEMEGRKTSHAGGASKNRMIDEVITLPRGNYVAYYETDGSHSYRDWNSDPPYDEASYGLSIYGWGENFDPKSVGSFSEGDEENVIAQIIRVKDNRHMTKGFSLDRPTRVRIYALGEGVDRDMADYGWIEDARTGRTIWEMTYRMTDRAGGARKNRKVSTTIMLEKGEYELHYRTDGSHAFNDWNDDPPEDRIHWGITVTKEE